MPATGQCLCGAVTFKAEAVEPHVHACHCSMCRRWTGTTMMAASVGRVEFEGSEHIKTYASSAWAERGFCRECGSSLFYLLKPDRYIMAIGGFDDVAQFALAGEIYVDSKPAFFDLAGDHERLTEQEFLASIGQTKD